MKFIAKSIFFFAFIGLASTATAKVSFKFLKEHTPDKASEICGDLCMAKCNADGNSKNVAWDFHQDILPNAPQEKKDALIANYQTCLEMGLPTVAKNFELLKTFTIMIPRGLFLTEKEGVYDKKMRFSDPKKEFKTNFENFVEWATPIFEKHFETLKVNVWQMDNSSKK